MQLLMRKSVMQTCPVQKICILTPREQWKVDNGCAKIARLGSANHVASSGEP